jgi:anti-sigma-K factor RskA
MTHEHLDKPREQSAAEYVLGIMNGEERAQFEQRLASDYGLQAEVTAWEERLSPLQDLVDPADPPAAVWQQIQQRIEPQEEKSSFWNSVGFWRNLGMVASSLVLVLGLTIFGIKPDSTMDQVMMVTNEQAQVEWVVGTPGRSDMLMVKAMDPPDLPKGQVCQLWMVMPDGSFKSVGVMPHSGTMEMKVPSHLKDNSNFTISIESEDNMPTHKPTGKIVFQGALIKI